MSVNNILTPLGHSHPPKHYAANQREEAVWRVSVTKRVSHGDRHADDKRRQRHSANIPVAQWGRVTGGIGAHGPPTPS